MILYWILGLMVVSALCFGVYCLFTVGNPRNMSVDMSTDYIKEPRWKIMVNPFDDNKMYWTKLDPQTHIWHWQHEATERDVDEWNQLPDNMRTNGLPHH